MGFEAASHNLDEYAKGTAHAAVSLGDAVLPTQTFNILRSMVKSWSVEAAKGDGLYRYMIDHFWRWISSPAAKLYDPALHRFVHGLMRKTFSQLLAEFRRLGSEIVHADFSRIWLLTSKPSSSNAFAYANYVVSSVTSRELFRYINLDIIRFWDQLVWMDSANHAGVICHHPEQVDDPDEEIEIEMHWNISTFLPPGVQEEFSVIVARFVNGMHFAKRQSSDSIRTPLRILQNGSATGVDPNKADELELARKFINQDLTRQLLKVVTKLVDRYADKEQREDFVFPILPGSHLKMKNPILEYIKTTCVILSLAKDVATEVLVLKRNLLDLINVREFANEAAFKNPCLPFKVPMVVCLKCNTPRGECLVPGPPQRITDTRTRPRSVSRRRPAHAGPTVVVRALRKRVRSQRHRSPHDRRYPTPRRLVPTSRPPLRSMQADQVGQLEDPLRVLGRLRDVGDKGEPVEEVAGHGQRRGGPQSRDCDGVYRVVEGDDWELRDRS